MSPTDGDDVSLEKVYIVDADTCYDTARPAAKVPGELIIREPSKTVGEGTPMNECIAIVSDMIFSSRIVGTAEKVGVKCSVVRTAEALSGALETGHPAIVLVDMHCESFAPDEAIRTVKSQCPQARVVAFFSHVQTELMELAKAAGADDVWPRSAFVQRLPQLLAGTGDEDAADAAGQNV